MILINRILNYNPTGTYLLKCFYRQQTSKHISKGRWDIVFKRFFSLTSEDKDVRASENLGGRPGGLPRMSENTVSCLSEDYL